MNCSAMPAPAGTRRPLAPNGVATHGASVAVRIATSAVSFAAFMFAAFAAAAVMGVTPGIAEAASAQGQAELDDAAARMQYAYYTEDLQALQNVLRLTAELDVASTLASSQSYQLAYGYWKLAQLYVQRQAAEPAPANAKQQAMQAAQSCVQHARRAVSADAAFGEAYAIEAACNGFSIAPQAGAPPSADCARSRSLRKALAVSPGSPRVRLIEALCAGADGGDPATLERWRTVVTNFESSPPARPGPPDWGHVEALTTLGSLYLQRGDPVAARDVLERALVLVPDYRAAQKLLQTAAARPH